MKLPVVLPAVFGLAIGIISAGMINVPVWAAVLCCLFCSIIFVLDRKFISILGLTGMFFTAGVLSAVNAHTVSDEHISNSLKYYRNAPAVLRGEIISDISKRQVFNTDKYMAVFRVYSIRAPWGWVETNGKILLQVFRDTGMAYGDTIEVTGKLHQAYDFDTDSRFSYRKYLYNRGIRAVLSVKNIYPVRIISTDSQWNLRRPFTFFRGRCRDILNRYLSVNEAGIMRAVLLGDRGNIPKHVKDLFVRTGSAHILAISGLHVGVVAGIFILFVRSFPFPRKLQFLAALVLLWGYVLMTEGRPSVIRASLMLSIVMIGYISERSPEAFNSLCVAALVILSINPLSVYDAGFQLSFVCVTGIILISPVLCKVLSFGWSMNGYMIQAVCVSMSVWLAAAGLIAYHFETWVPITVPANLLVVPLVGVIVSLGFVLLLAGLYCPPLAVCTAYCLKCVLNLMAGGLYLLDKLPGSSIAVKGINVWHVTGYYLIVILIIAGCRLAQKGVQQRRSLIDKAWLLS